MIFSYAWNKLFDASDPKYDNTLAKDPSAENSKNIINMCTILSAKHLLSMKWEMYLFVLPYWSIES